MKRVAWTLMVAVLGCVIGCGGESSSDDGEEARKREEASQDEEQSEACRENCSKWIDIGIEIGCTTTPYGLCIEQCSELDLGDCQADFVEQLECDTHVVSAQLCYCGEDGSLLCDRSGFCEEENATVSACIAGE